MADFATSTHPGVQAQLDRLQMTSPAGDRLGLERIARLLDRLGRPQDSLPPVFHVAGTNGKGSTVAMLRAGLEAAGYRVHAFTSPHLVRFNERIRIAGRLIEDSPLEALLAEVLDHSSGIEPSFFEVATAAAFLAFARTPTDACLLEVGLGGRLDATNVIERSLVGGIASLGLDHQQFLGDTIEAIAAEKAAIARAAVPLIALAQPAEAEAVIVDTAQAAGAALRLEGRDWQLDSSLQTSLAGSHQLRNANLAWQMLAAQDVVPVDRAEFEEGLRAVTWPARLQLLGPGPLTERARGRRLWVDGGHNREAALAIASAIAPLAPVDLVFGLLKNRTVADVLGPLAPLVRRAQAVPIPGHECHEPAQIVALAKAGIGPRDIAAGETLEQAIDRLAGADGPAADILIFGSLYLAGDALRLNREIPD